MLCDKNHFVPHREKPRRPESKRHVINPPIHPLVTGSYILMYVIHWRNYIINRFILAEILIYLFILSVFTRFFVAIYLFIYLLSIYLFLYDKLIYFSH